MKHEVEEEFSDILPAIAKEMIRKHFTRRQSKDVCHSQIVSSEHDSHNRNNNNNTVWLVA